ncbi:tetratricopeptide repeat protein [Streptomyces sp. SKN60]|uniref:tetratricopeptide repeat protein n=1 Tax=Streptomyces sp. SKN60 TaxID=2855506 RepID=UPI00224662CE|nr:tetratricopeptide repeat protein [Streptomyces sp. SKN60]MCX2183085.1 tetratricopeptide repeat protein [Streptomyces sp. SKN60]
MSPGPVVRNEIGGTATVHGPVVQAGRIDTLTVAAAVPAILPGSPAPRLLPAPAPHFTDQHDELARLTALLDGADGTLEEDPAPRVVVLTGTGGIGKSATALHFAARLRDRYGGGQLHADLRGDATATAATPSTVLVRFLRALGVAPPYLPADEQEQIDWYRTLTADRRMLTVLDNAHSAAQVLPLLPTGPGSLTLVTSRRRLDGLTREAGARVIQLPPLGPADAALLLTRLSGREAPHPAAAEAVARRCGGLPLALCMAGERLAVRTHLTWQQLEQDMATAAAPSDEPGNDGTDSLTTDPVTAAADTSYDDLTPGAARLYRLGGLRPWPALTAPAAAALTEVTEPEAADLLDELAAIHLLEEHAAGRYRHHDLLRVHAERRALRVDGHPRAAAAVGRLLRHHLAAAAAADARVMPGRWHLGPAYDRLPPDPRTAEQATDWLLAERENLVEAVRTADEYGLDDLTWQLCEALWSLFLRHGFHQDWLATHRLGVRAAARCPAVPEAEGRMHAQLGFALKGLGRLDEAEQAFTAAAEADRRCGHRRGEATAVESLGLVRLEQRRYEEAEACFLAAEALTDDPRARALLAHHRGRALSGRGEHARAAATLEQAGRLMTELPVPDTYNQARVLTSLGQAALAAGDRERAADVLAEAAGRMRQEKAPVQDAALAELRARAAATPDERRVFLTEAAGLHERLGSPRAAALRAELAATDTTDASDA